MTELEAEQIQNSINVLQEMLRSHYDSINRIRPQCKGLKTRTPIFKISWKINMGILESAEYINSGDVPIIIKVFSKFKVFSPTSPMGHRDEFAPIGETRVDAGRTTTVNIGYSCSDDQPIVFDVSDSRNGEILERYIVK